MKDWPILQQLLSEALTRFLSESLPDVGGEDWWQNYVVANLTPPQLRAVQDIAQGDLAAFDLAALLRIADRNWAEVAIKLNLRRGARTHIIELKEVRNRYAHAAVRGVELEDQLRDVDTIKRVLQIIGATPSVLEQVTAIHRGLLRELAQTDGQSFSPPNQLEDAPETSPNDDATGGSDAGAGTTTPESFDDIGDPVDKSSSWIVSPTSATSEVAEAIGQKTFVGIDFGTSTTVVSVVMTENSGWRLAKTLQISQPAELGGSITHHLVNTVLAWTGEQLLFGRDAYRLRQELIEGYNVFSSFKMRLGVDVGPTYPQTALRRGDSDVAIEDANDATTEFFRLLLAGIREAIRDEGLPEDLGFAVSVPASFEANQRRDLLRNMAHAGFPDQGVSLIDEPNAAFLSFLQTSARTESNLELLDRFKTSGTNILVYDFGAGTCDISILEVRLANDNVVSRNRAISRFTALGGDDIDRAIARVALLPQLVSASAGYTPEQRDVEERIIPRLQPSAERLKLAAIEWLTTRGIDTLKGIRDLADEEFSDHGISSFRIRGHSLSLDRPSMTLAQLADAIQPFVARYDPDKSTTHVFAPVANAIEKSGLDAAELDAVIFIGGSAANPIVRNAVMRHLPATVKAVVPTDLRSHVSLGASLHSLCVHALGKDIIQPITSESIYVITRGGGLETAIPAGAEVPTPNPYLTRLRIDRPSQTVVELPICVGSESKLLGLLRITSKETDGFTLGEEVLVSASLTHDKLLHIEASVAGVKVQTGLLNPPANTELTPDESKMLEAKQKFNLELLSSKGRPSKDVVLAYAEAASDAEAFELAAEMYMAVERIDPSEDHATNICYCFSRAKRSKQSIEWARRAHDRDPSAITAYNLSCNARGYEKESLLRESLKFDPTHSYSLLSLGRLLSEQGDPEGKRLLQMAAKCMERDLEHHCLSKQGCSLLVRLADDLGLDELSERAQARFDAFSANQAFDEDNLAASMSSQVLIERG